MSNPELDQSIFELREIAQTCGITSTEYIEAHEILSQQYGSDLSYLGIEPPGDQTNGGRHLEEDSRPTIPTNDEP